MKKSTKLAKKASEIRVAVNKIDPAADDAAEKRTKLLGELETTESEYQTAMVEEDEAESRSRDTGGLSPEEREARDLTAKAEIREWFAAAAQGKAPEGRAAEVNAAHKAPLMGRQGGPVVPWAVLRSEIVDGEARAFSTTGGYDGPIRQRPILQELFGPGIADTLGLRFDDAGVGSAEYPLLTGNVAPTQLKEATAASAAAATSFTVATLKPKRMAAELEFTHEQAASVIGVEMAYRKNVIDNLRSQMQKLLLTGVAPTNANPQHVEGFLTKLTGTDLSSAEAVYADYGAIHAQAVNGIHAMTETEVSSIIGISTYRHAASVYQTGSGESATEALKRRSRACLASVYVPDVASMKQSAVLHAGGSNGGMMRGDSVGAMWGGGIEVIRDQFTKASQGIVLTAILLWDAHTVLRADAYKQIDIQVA